MLKWFRPCVGHPFCMTESSPSLYPCVSLFFSMNILSIVPVPVSATLAPVVIAAPHPSQVLSQQRNYPTVVNILKDSSAPLQPQSQRKRRLPQVVQTSLAKDKTPVRKKKFEEDDLSDSSSQRSTSSPSLLKDCHSRLKALPYC